MEDYNMLDYKKIEMANILRKVGMTRPIALTLSCLSDGQELSSRYIEKVSGLRQPEVSIATRYLLENEWIDIREEKVGDRKGRPTKYYKLVVPINIIAKDIENEILSQKKYTLENVEYLKKYL